MANIKFLSYMQVLVIDYLGAKLIFFFLNYRSVTSQVEATYYAFEFPSQVVGIYQGLFLLVLREPQAWLGKLFKLFFYNI